MGRLSLVALVLTALAWPCIAALAEEPDYGILNPQGMTVAYCARRVDDTVFHPSMCWVVYPALKIGNNAAARKILERCAREGMEGAMPAIASIEENGIDRPTNPMAAAVRL